MPWGPLVSAHPPPWPPIVGPLVAAATSGSSVKGVAGVFSTEASLGGSAGVVFPSEFSRSFFLVVECSFFLPSVMWLAVLVDVSALVRCVLNSNASVIVALVA